jgi:hypothetical protein
MAYGENADFNDIQSSAPLAATPSVSNMRTRNQRPTGPSVAATPLFSPTQRPDEPVTAGAPFGPGDGPSTPMMISPPQATLSTSLQKIAAYSSNPQISYLLNMAERFNW